MVSDVCDSDNRNFWKTVDLLFSEKVFRKELFVLNNNNKTICNNEELAENFSKHSSKILVNLDIEKTLTINVGNLDITDPVFNTN